MAVRSMQRRFWPGGGKLALVMFAGVVVATGWTLLQPRPAPTWQSAKVEHGDIESSVAAIGTLQPVRSVDVGAQVSGQITRIHVAAGDTVKKGQLLAEIDASVLVATVESGQAQIASLRADEARLGYTRIAGVVTGLDVKEGQTLNATNQTPTMQRSADFLRMTVWTDVSEAEPRHVKAGETAYFTPLGGDECRWIGTVRHALLGAG